MAEFWQKIVLKFVETITSKKFQAFAMIAYATLRNDDVPGLFAMSEATLDRLIAETMVYLGAVGITDHGKGKQQAQVEENKLIAAKIDKVGSDKTDTDSPDKPI